MKRCATALTLLMLIVPAVLRADVTVTSTITITGPVAAMLGGNNPQMTMRVKGSRARMDIDMMGQKMSNIIDIAAKQITMLMHAQKTAQVMDAQQLVSRMPSAEQMPKMDGKIEPTGQTQEINGQRCSEFRYSVSLDMSNVAANFGAAGGTAQMPAGANEMFKDLKMIMSGSLWVSKEGPGVAEYLAFTKEAQQNLISLSPFGRGAGLGGAPGMEDMMRVFSQVDGLTHLAEVEMTFEGNNPMVDMMKSMGTMKMTTRVVELSTQPLADDLFQVPADYTVTKQ